MNNSIIEMRWLDDSEWTNEYIKRTELKLQYRTRTNLLEIELHEPIWSDWQDVPTVFKNEIRD